MATNAFAAGAYAATQSLNNPFAAKKTVSTDAVQGTGAGGFNAMVSNVLDAASQSGRQAEQQMIKAASGKADVVDVATAVAEAESTLETLVAIRDKVIQSYEAVMNMPV